MKIQVDGVGQFEVPDSFGSFSPAEQDAAIAEMAAQSAKGIRSSIAAEKDANLPTQSLPEYDAMGNPTGGTVSAPVAPQMPYGEQMQNALATTARGTGQVANAIANGMTFGLANKGVAGLRAATGDAPDYATALQQQRAETAAIPGSKIFQGIGAGLTGYGLGGAGLSLGVRATEGGLGLLPRALGFGTDAAAFSAAQEAGNQDKGTWEERAKDAAKAAGWGGILGAGLPLGAEAIGAATRYVAPFAQRGLNGFSRATTGLLSQNLTPEGVQALNAMGPAAMVADTTPGTQGLAQGIAAKTDQPGGDLVNALRARQTQTPQRLNTDITANLGPDTSPVVMEQAARNQQLSASPIYQQALNNAPAVDTTNTLAEIGRRLNTAPEGSSQRAALERARTMLMRDTNAGPIPVDNAETLLNTRQELDKLIDYGDANLGLSPGASRRESTPLWPIRQELDRALKTQVPGIRQADEMFSTAREQLDALNQGRQLFGTGPDAIRPSDLAAVRAGQSPAEQLFMRQGARGAVENTVGTNPNDLQAARRLFGDPLDWNRAKATQVFGAQPTEAVVRAIEREQRFAETANKAIAGSRTAPMAEASKSIDAASEPLSIIPKNATLTGLLGHAGESIVNKTLATLAGGRGETARQQLSGILRMSPDDARGLLQAVLDRQLADAARGRTISSLLSNPAITRGILTYENQPRQQRR
jgi:hypothetical protein